MKIRSVQEVDLENIVKLYNFFIENTVVTFETEPIAVSEMKSRIDNILCKYPFLIAEVDSEFVGYAYATRWKERAAYFATVESTVYLNSKFHGKGFGYALYSALLSELKKSDTHSVIGGIADKNAASIALHTKCGFKPIGTLKEVGFKHDRWIDVSYFQKIL